MIPEGERFVVEAVKRYRGDIDDPQLRRQANAFVGQESVHQREHERLNEVLSAAGYPTGFVHRMGVVLHGIGRRLPRRTQLAIAAAIEHWTAVLAEHSLAGDRPSPENRPTLSTVDEEISAFITWHLIEEIEHKSVAFDIMQALGTVEDQRIGAMRILVLLVGPALALGLLVSLAKDPAAWDPRNVAGSVRWGRENSTLSRRSFKDDIRTWSRRGFHPDERDHTDLLERWRVEAFGPGSIVEQRSRRRSR